jgi:hypothetical protein
MTAGALALRPAFMYISLIILRAGAMTGALVLVALPMMFMKASETVLHQHGSCSITLFHDPLDPSTWIVRQWRKGLLGRKCVQSKWFVTRGQAEQFAKRLGQECERARRMEK